MVERVSRAAVTFAAPFFVESLGRDQSAGTYEVETVEETIEDLSFVAYRVKSTSILLPVAGRGPNSFQFVPIPPSFVRTTLLQSDTSGCRTSSGET